MANSHTAEELDNINLALPLDDISNMIRTRSPSYTSPSIHSATFSEYSIGSETGETESEWNPPAWKKAASGWYSRSLGGSVFSATHSREASLFRSPSPSRDVLELAQNCPLPPSLAPTPSPSRIQSREVSPELSPFSERYISPMGENEHPNYIRFSVNAEVRHGVDPYMNAVSWFKSKIAYLTRSRTSTFFSLATALMSLFLFGSITSTPVPGPVPDLVKVATVATNFEPLIFYSQHGVMQTTDLQETAMAVWDLGETVRWSNMTSAPVIRQQLTELSDSMKTLALEMTRFFANVDGDVESILIVTDWAMRELALVQAPPTGKFATAVENVHGALSRAGVLERNGSPTPAGLIVTGFMGQTYRQKKEAALQRTFSEFLGIVEESVSNQLTHQTLLFGLHEIIENQFQNLQRTISRELDQQQVQEDEILSSLWMKYLGRREAQVQKYEKNKKLLRSMGLNIRENKKFITDSYSKLTSLQSSLEDVRRRLFKPLVREVQSTGLSVNDQIRGLEGVNTRLSSVRAEQKAKVMDMIYGAGSRRSTIVRGDPNREIDAGAW